MKNLNEFNSKIEYVLTDIDDTMTSGGQLGSRAYSALWQLHDAGLKIIPITGRPAGWCEMIARFWPVAGVVGENGGFYFRYDQKMHRWFFYDDKTIKNNSSKLEEIKKEILASVPGSAVSSDQFCRLMDLAIDFCEDVTPLDKVAVEKIVRIFNQHGAHAKVSSIHVNGWFGDYDKVSTSFHFLKEQFGLSQSDMQKKCVFIGDSPNDEPMFAKFPISFGVANINKFVDQMKSLPTYVTPSKGGDGFAEVAACILKNRR
ncbi:MAG: HAD family phosphatase [Bdellovibrionaceae bacterium]|nr:HAD family phosphatase [Bdellovibrio sp.]